MDGDGELEAGKRLFVSRGVESEEGINNDTWGRSAR